VFSFSEDEIQRYSRHILLQEVGGSGQQRLKDSKVLVVGAGGLGSPSAYYLAAAGVGTIGIIDDDVVELSNLQRQILHDTEDVGRPKAESAARRLLALNPGIDVRVIKERLDEDNVMDLVREYDVVLDGVDNFPTRYLVNDACVLTGTPLVDAGILRWDGLCLTVKPGEGPCYRCLFPEPPPDGMVPSCQEAGVVGAIAGVMGTIQAIEVVKVLLGIGETYSGRILTFDALKGQFRELNSARDKDCPVCGENPTITKPQAYDLTCEIQVARAASSAN